MNVNNVMRICLVATEERATQASPPPIIRRPRPYGKYPIYFLGFIIASYKRTRREEDHAE